MTKTLIFLLGFTALTNTLYAQISYPGPRPGKAKADLNRNEVSLRNKLIEASWLIQENRLSSASFHDTRSGQKISFGAEPLFSIILKNGKTITSNNFTLKATAVKQNIEKLPKSLKYADRLGGKKLRADLVDEESGLNVRWEAILVNDANYVRQVVTLSPKDSLSVERINVIHLNKSSGVTVAGKVDGSPLILNNMFFALEHPMSQVKEESDALSVFIPRLDPIGPQTSISVSTVWGTTPTGQMRRGFLYYVENERATPYRQNLHYNSWYDLSWIDRKLDEAQCLERIQTFADSLIVKRKVPMTAFLFDDGWDNNQTLWQFNKGFPNGFSKMSALAKKYGVDLGVWISPWGGYLEDQKQRLEYGRKQNPPFETNKNGFSLAGPIYFERFSEVAASFVQKYNVSLFKFDGVGAGNGASGASVTYQKDIEALVKLIDGLRAINPSLYFSLTVGTWPSVYWLDYGDVIWRAGKDTHGVGEGSNRQKWITYRDAETYKNIVKQAPLFPLNAVMYHGICIAENGPPGKYEMNDKDISDEIWSFFGTGTGLQELYINPHKLNSGNWDTLSDAIKWSRTNVDVLPDVHWVGGNPAKGEVYGYAAWSPGKAVLTLRNPSAERKIFKVDVADVFELPVKKTKEYWFYNAKEKFNKSNYVARGISFELTLEPFDVKVLNAIAK